MTAQELGKLAAALELTKTAAHGDALKRIGNVVLKLIKDVGGHRLHESAAVTKPIRRHMEHAQRLGETLKGLEAAGANPVDIQAASQRLLRAREATDAMRDLHRRKLGLFGAGLGAGAASALLTGTSGPPPGSVPGQSAPLPAPIYIAGPQPRER